jgi:hypothetical protein
MRTHELLFAAGFGGGIRQTRTLHLRCKSTILISQESISRDPVQRQIFIARRFDLFPVAKNPQLALLSEKTCQYFSVKAESPFKERRNSSLHFNNSCLMGRCALMLHYAPITIWFSQRRVRLSRS